MVKVSIVTQFYPPDYAATGQLIEELARQLGSLGLDVQVLTGQPGYGQQRTLARPVEVAPPVTVRRSRTSRLWPQRIRGRAINGFLFCLRSGLRLLKPGRRGDVLMVTTEPPYLPCLGYLANLAFGIPYVCLLYDLYPDVAVELDVIPERHPLVRLWDWLNVQVWQQARGIIVLSSSMRDRVLAKCPDVADKISVVHSWSDPERIAPKPKAENPFARQHGLSDRFVVLYSGNMGRCHDMQTILEAARELRDEPYVFLFIGGGAKSRDCRETAAAWGLDNCRFLPFQDKSVLPDSLTSGDLSLVSVDRGMEGLVAPSKLYGILAAGCPVAAICEPTSYLTELLDSAQCGATFANGDSGGLANYIRHLAANPALVEQLGRSGRDYLEQHFTPAIVAKQYAAVLTASRPARARVPRPTAVEREEAV